jgi:hypothetical protein
MKITWSRFAKSILLSGVSFVLLLNLGCSDVQKVYPDCRCTPQNALINEVSIHTLQTARFSQRQMIEYMRDKCLSIDSSQPFPSAHISFYPVLICGIPGEMTTHDPDQPFPSKFLYDFISTLDFIDSTSKELGISLPTLITSNAALHDTLGHRVHTFRGPDNDSVALYWHGIHFNRALGRIGMGVELAIYDSTEWSNTIPNIKRMYEERGIPLPRNIEN